MNDIQAVVSTHVETVALLSKLHESKHHVNVKLDMDELDLTSAEAKATYKEIEEWVQEHYGFHVTNLNIANGLMNVKGIYNLLTILGYMATNDGNFLLETSDLNPVELCLNILNTDISIYNEKEYIKEASQLMMQNPEVKKEMELKRKRLEEAKQQKERINQLIEADKEERKIRFKYNK